MSITRKQIKLFNTFLHDRILCSCEKGKILQLNNTEKSLLLKLVLIKKKQQSENRIYSKFPFE